VGVESSVGGASTDAFGLEGPPPHVSLLYIAMGGPRVSWWGGRPGWGPWAGALQIHPNALMTDASHLPSRGATVPLDEKGPRELFPVALPDPSRAGLHPTP
jgi:hypothetical protein